MIYIRKIKFLRYLTDTEPFVRQKKLLGFFDSVMLTEIHRTFPAIFLEQLSKIALANSAYFSNIANFHAIVLLQKLYTCIYAGIFVFNCSFLSFLTNCRKQFVY